jgi:hypothetical protein
MKKSFCVIALIASSALAHAACDVQSVAVLSADSELARWDVVSDEIHPITLPNGFQLGLQIEPASAEKNSEFAKKMKGLAEPVELVKISLYDLGGSRARQLTHTWGGVNSLQGYGPAGGADGVMEIGEPGIVLDLKKTECSHPRS